MGEVGIGKSTVWGLIIAQLATTGSTVSGCAVGELAGGDRAILGSTGLGCLRARVLGGAACNSCAGEAAP
jgi:hypothetical protein